MPYALFLNLFASPRSNGNPTRLRDLIASRVSNLARCPCPLLLPCVCVRVCVFPHYAPAREYYARLSAFVHSLARDDAITSADNAAAAAAAAAATASNTAGTTATTTSTAAVTTSEATAPATAAVVAPGGTQSPSSEAR